MSQVFIQNQIWTPLPEWEGEDAFVIGGGASLKKFNFNILEGKNTIACNESFRLGNKIVKYVLFSDIQWFHKSKWDLEAAKITLVSVTPNPTRYNLPWYKQMEREMGGLHKGSKLGWNYSTGAAAINLAISLGAWRIFLLGIDMSKRGNVSHYHSRYGFVSGLDTLQRHLAGLQTVIRELRKFPQVTVINVTDGLSHIDGIENITFEHLTEIIANESDSKDAETAGCLLEARSS